MIQDGPSGSYVLKYGGCEVPFQIIVGERSTLTINVFPDMRVEVLAPSNKSLDTVLIRVDRRAQWIVKQWCYFQKLLPIQPKRRYISGETHLYLGRQYRLKVVKSDESSVRLSGRYFLVQHLNPNDSSAISSLLNEWYFDHALSMFKKRIEILQSDIRTLASLVPRDLVVRRMKNRWGSCSPKRLITLNLDLVKTPIRCIDYVLVHELCHLKIYDHSPAFYRLLGRCLPDWKARKKRLEEFVV